MTIFDDSLLQWKKTSRNTEIAVFGDNHYGNVLFKRSLLLTASSIEKQMVAYDKLRSITSQMAGVTSPFPHPTLSESMHESVLDAFDRAIHF